jgi:hypothetical protein
MITKNIYCISNIGTITHYAHFFYAVLVPLIYYDYKTKSEYFYNIKINVGGMEKILLMLFPNRIKFDYEKPEKLYISDKMTYYHKFIKLKKSNNSNDVLLDAFDIFDCELFMYFIKNFSNNEYLKLEDYYYKNIGNILYKDKLRYKQLYVTDKFYKLRLYKPIIKHFFNSKISKKSNKEIVLIERKFDPKLWTNINNPNFYHSYAQRRIVYNHDELKRKLKKIYKDKFINIELDGLSIFEQYNLFSNAKVIIGQHGAGLSNIYFMNDNSTVIEICPEWNNVNHSFDNLAKICNLNYIPIKQNMMTKEEWFNFKKKYKLNIEVNDNIFNTKLIKDISCNINNLSKIKKLNSIKLQRKPLESFIINSGSVNVENIINKIKL